MADGSVDGGERIEPRIAHRRMMNREKKSRYRERQRERELKALLVSGVEAMGDAKWEETQNAILFEMAQRPGPNAANQIKAIELINKRKEQQKFGTRAAVEETRARCAARLKELEGYEAWGRAGGVPDGAGEMASPEERKGLVGQQDTHREDGEASTGRSGRIEKVEAA